MKQVRQELGVRAGRKVCQSEREGFTRSGCPFASRTSSPPSQRGAVSAAPGGGAGGEGGTQTRGARLQVARTALGRCGVGRALLEAGAPLALFWFYPGWPRVRGARRAEPEGAPPTRAKGRPPPAERRRPAARGELSSSVTLGGGGRRRRPGRGRGRRKRAPLKGQRGGPARVHAGKRPKRGLGHGVRLVIRNTEAGPGVCVCVRAPARLFLALPPQC